MMGRRGLKYCSVAVLSTMVAGFSTIGICQTGEVNDANRRTNSFGLGLGLDRFGQRDQLESPYTYSGIMFASSLSYRRRGPTDLHIVETFFSLGGINSDALPANVAETVGMLSYSYVHKVVNAPVGAYLGGGLSSTVMSSDFKFSSTYSSWYWNHSLNLVLAADYCFGKGRSLSVELTAPVVGLISRPKNGSWLNGDNWDVMQNFLVAAGQGVFQPFWSAPAVFASVGYTQPVSGHLNVRGTYRFAYVASDRPAETQSLRMFMNVVLVGLEWVF